MKRAICLLLLASLVGCSFFTEEPQNKTLQNKKIVVQSGRMGHKPWMPQASYSSQITLFNAIFTPLVRVNRFYEIHPGIFTSWKWDEEKRQYSFTINDKLKFSEDRPLKLKDIEFAFVKTMISEKDDATKVRFDDILCSEKISKNSKFRSGMCSGIILDEPNKITVKLRKPNPLFIYKLSELMNPVAPIEDFKKDLVSFKGIPRGTGSYRISWSDPDSTLVRLELKRKSASEKRPQIVDLYAHGTSKEHNVDISLGVSNDTIKDNKQYRRITGDFAKAMNVLDFNFNNKFGKSYEFRKAVSHAINRKQLDDVYDVADSTDEITLPEYFGHLEQNFDYSPKISREIVKKHFKGFFSKEKPLKALFHGPLSLKTKKKYVRELEKQFQKVGLYFDFSPFEITSFDKDNRDVVLAIYGLATSFVDPLAAFSNYRPGSVLSANFDRTDKKAERLFENATNAVSREDMAKAVKELTAYHQSKYTFLPLMKFAPRFLVKKSKVKSIGIDKIQYGLDLNYVELVENE